MKKAKSILFMLVFVLLASSMVVAQQPALKGTKKAATKKVTVDTRVDNMGYWREMASQGLVPVAPVIPVEKGTFTGSKIEARGVLRLDSPDIPLTTENSTQSENSIFADPSDKNHVLNSNNSTQNPVGSLYGANDFYTFDGGATWGGEIQGAGGSNSGDPTTAISNTGRMYVNYIHNNYGQGISYSDDFGQNWTTKQVAPNPGSMCDKNHMWIDNSISSPYEGNLYVAWTNFGGSNDAEIGIARSTNDGVTWSSPLSISNAINAGSHNQGVNLQTGPDGEVYALWAVYDSWPSDETALGFAR
ncbi:MAG: sialidase family protein, partial [Bacteroidota bacterium]